MFYNLPYYVIHSIVLFNILITHLKLSQLFTLYNLIIDITYLSTDKKYLKNMATNIIYFEKSIQLLFVSLLFSKIAQDKFIIMLQVSFLFK